MMASKVVKKLEHFHDKVESDSSPNITNSTTGAKHEREPESSDKPKKTKQPPGGFDSTSIPHAPPGYTLKFTFHRATNLPYADIYQLSADPFILAQLNTKLQPRHKEDPYLRVRSFTVRKQTNPVWNFEWVVANVPTSGFKLKVRIYDEDPGDHDDRLGNVHVDVPSIDEKWDGIRNQPYKVKKRMGSKRAYASKAIAVCIDRRKKFNPSLYISVEMLGRTNDEEGGRCYTLGPCWWTKHYSPLLGRIANRKDTYDGNATRKQKPRSSQRYNFQANQIQLRGPIPAELYHRYVEFRPLIRYGFTKSGLTGFLFNKALHHQHGNVYNFERSTVYGIFGSPGEDVTLKFLELAHFDTKGRIFTYVLTLDSLLRFTETGKEFGIDMLSKHTMHSDVSIYIAFSGEFFVRRLQHPHRDPPEVGGHNESHPPDLFEGGPPDDDPPKDPRYYELVIDNDSGTYRPNGALLPKLKEFLSQNLPGLQIITLDCQKDAEKMARMKDEQRERKAMEGGRMIYTQLSRTSTESSSDEEALDALEAAGRPMDRGLLQTTRKDLTRLQSAKRDKLMRDLRRQKMRMKDGGPQEKAPLAEGERQAETVEEERKGAIKR